MDNTRERFTDGLSIASCWRSARFSSANWRRDLKKEQKDISIARTRLSMPILFQESLEKVNEFRPIRFSGGTGHHQLGYRERFGGLLKY